MIKQIDGQSATIRVGVPQPMTVWADAPLEVAIRCFVSRPPPPGYRPCAECGTISVASGQQFNVTASRAVFLDADGELRVTIQEKGGQKVELGFVVTATPETEPEPEADVVA